MNFDYKTLIAYIQLVEYIFGYKMSKNCIFNTFTKF